MTTPDRVVYPGESPSESSSRAPRVNQLDSEELDSALVGMISDKLSRSLDNFKSSFSNGFKPELELLIKLIIFRYGIWNYKINASPGSKLQNLKLISSRSSRTNHPTKRILLLYLLLHPPIFPNYVLTRIREHALSNRWPDLPNHDFRQKVWKVIGKLENTSRIWELLGWIGFLFDGKYPSLLMRILKLRLVPSQPHLTRLVSYEFMNRQLVWGAFTEFLMFSIPLLPPLPPSLNPTTHITHFKSLLSPPPRIDYANISSTTNANSLGLEPEKHTGLYANLPKSICPICYKKNSSAPVPLSSTGQGSNLTLPPIQGANLDDFGHEHNKEDREGEEENRIFIPAQTDCKGECKWCYYCIGEELYKHQEAKTSDTRRKKDKKKPITINGKGIEKKDEKEDQEDEIEKMECLRCGDGITRAWRVGSEGN
ncbi:uncharacterized protein IL334_003294 [Kwoniella shivajii]|uniref:RING-type E3 ubiquitin transferase (cysteine targeting) n=1 Tax=Kwoniella shivajii TaxID=564305 RepID=A0ABZ1CX65_9TREE|nr:hypothetical protein IL334_003294 [Kwoniella shivajii]